MIYDAGVRRGGGDVVGDGANDGDDEGLRRKAVVQEGIRIFMMNHVMGSLG